MFKVLHVAIYNDRDGSYLNSLGFFEVTNCSTLVQARDVFIKQARAEYSADRYPGDEPASEAIYKFPFRSDLVGYYHFEDGLSFVFGETHPVYKLVKSGNYDGDDLACRLDDLFLYHDKLHREKQRKLAA